jgi:hypothetical protein
MLFPFVKERRPELRSVKKTCRDYFIAAWGIVLGRIQTSPRNSLQLDC